MTNISSGSSYWNLILYTRHICNIQLYEIVAMDFCHYFFLPNYSVRLIPLGDLKPLAPFDDALRKRHAGNSRLHAFACLFFFQLEIKQICLGKKEPKEICLSVPATAAQQYVGKSQNLHNRFTVCTVGACVCSPVCFTNVC